MSMQNLYEQELLDHYQNPRNYGLGDQFDFLSPLYNPSCGDAVTISGLVQDGNIVQISFEGKGCVISLAMASMLTQYAQNKTFDEVMLFDEHIVEKLLKMQLGLKRMQCGMLSIQALQKGIQLHKAKMALK